MKFIIPSILFTLLLAVQAEVTWEQGGPFNLTCTSHDDGNIGCKIGNLPETVPSHTSDLSNGAEEHDHHELASVPGGGSAKFGRRGLGLELDKRATCNIDQSGLPLPAGITCFAHCYAKGYCNSHCSSINVCVCNCKDKTSILGHYVHACLKTSC